MAIQFDFVGFGRSIRLSRQQRGVSLKQMEQLTGIPSNIISLCERGHKTDYETIATLSFVSDPYVNMVQFNFISEKLLLDLYAYNNAKFGSIL